MEIAGYGSPRSSTLAFPRRARRLASILPRVDAHGLSPSKYGRESGIELVMILLTQEGGWKRAEWLVRHLRLDPNTI